jgi:hypothetical protein
LLKVWVHEVRLVSALQVPKAGSSCCRTDPRLMMPELFSNLLKVLAFSGARNGYVV